jgi:hypothetical protein
MDIHCVIHVAQKGNWERSFHLLLSALTQSGLYDALKTIHVLCANPQQVVEKSAYFLPSKLQLINSGTPENYERPALWFTKNYSFGDSAKVLYLHSKGLKWWNTPNEQNVEDWVHLMLHWNVKCWKQALEKLDEGFDTYGCNVFQNQEHPLHYSGNFWWAKASYLKTLSNTIGPKYNDPETWILSNPQVKYFSAFQSGLEGFGHLEKPFPEYRLFSRGKDNKTPSDHIVIMNAHYGVCTFAETCKNSVQTYAALHGYHFFHQPASEFPGNPANSYEFHFWRSYVVQRAAEAFPGAKWFLWLDSDIYVNATQQNTRLQDLIEFDPYILYYTTDEKPWGIDIINTGFKLVNRDALKYEEEIWQCRDTTPWNTFTFEQLTLWNKIFPQIPGRYCIKENKKLNCIIKAYRNTPYLAEGLFIHMCNMSKEERNAWAQEAKDNKSMLSSDTLKELE